MRRTTIFLVTVATMASTLMAMRCSDDDEVVKASKELPPEDVIETPTPVPEPTAADVAKELWGDDGKPPPEVGTTPELNDDIDDGGVVRNPLPGADGAVPMDEGPMDRRGGRGSAEIDDGGSPLGDDTMRDEDTFEPTPVPEGAVDTN